MTEEPKHIIRPNGTQEWYLNGKLHREGGPAYEGSHNSCQEWWLHGERHRLDGPAQIYGIGTDLVVQEWWVHDQRHRSDGPAITISDGQQEWYVHGHRHRLDGPAYVGANNSQEWWVNGNHITSKVQAWMEQQGVTWPWDDETQMQFVLTFA
jgi:hypothetical protein